MNHTDQGQ